MKNLPAITPLQARMLTLAFLSQNVAIGCSFGGYGVGVLALQQHFGVGRGLASLGLPLLMLTMTLAGPVAAAWARRFGLRRIMMAGALGSGIGYLTLAIAPNIWCFLLAFALLVGPSVALFGPVAGSLLAGDWLPEQRGKAIGIAAAPIMLAAAPVAGHEIITHHGLTNWYFCIAVLHAMLLPLLFFVRDAPSVIAERFKATKDPKERSIDETSRHILRHPLFWIMAIGSGILNSVGVIATGQMVVVLVEAGVTESQAANLAAIMGAACIFGSLAAGFLSDRVGGAQTIAICGFGYALGWSIIGLTHQLPLLAIAVIAVGASIASVFTAVCVLSSSAFGPSSMAKVIAQLGVVALPLTFVLPSAFGAVRDLAGSYAPLISAMVLASAFIAMGFLYIARTERRRRPVQVQ